MTRIIFLMIAFIRIPAGLFGQNDDAAIKILEIFSDKATSAPSVSIDFDLITMDIIENTADTLSGSIILKGDAYRLTLPNNTIWFNGKTSWSFLPTEQELTITEPEISNLSFINRPSMIFTTYKAGYKCRLVSETNTGYLVDLYPEETTSDLIRIRLSIRKGSYDLSSFEYKRKDGYTATLYANNYDLSIKTEMNTFTFQTSGQQDIDVIDMR